MAGEDFRSAVREAERGSMGFTEEQYRTIFHGADRYAATTARDALLSLAAELEATAGRCLTDLAKGAYRRAAQMARSRAANPGLVSADSPPPSASVLRRLSATEDECLEAGP